MRSNRQEIEDLLFEAATDGLNASDAVRLETLLAANPDVDRGAFERAVALVLLAACGSVQEQMPPALRRSLLQQGEQELSLRR